MLPNFSNETKHEKDLNHNFNVAVMNHNLIDMNKLLKEKIDINQKGLCLGRTALHIAIIMAVSNPKKERLDVLKRLLSLSEIKLIADNQGLKPSQYKGINNLAALYPKEGENIYNKLTNLGKSGTDSNDSSDDDGVYYSYQALHNNSSDSAFMYSNFSSGFYGNTTNHFQQHNDDYVGINYGMR